MHLQRWEPLPFLTFSASGIKVLCPKHTEFDTPLLALSCQKGSTLPALVVYKSQSPIFGPSQIIGCCSMKKKERTNTSYIVVTFFVFVACQLFPSVVWISPTKNSLCLSAPGSRCRQRLSSKEGFRTPFPQEERERCAVFRISRKSSCSGKGRQFCNANIAMLPLSLGLNERKRMGGGGKTYRGEEGWKLFSVRGHLVRFCPGIHMNSSYPLWPKFYSLCPIAAAILAFFG